MTTTASHSPRAAGPSRLARFVAAAATGAARRPKLTIALWLALVVGLVAAGSFSGTRSLSNAASGVGESARAEARLHQAGLQDPATEQILVHSASRAQTAAAVASLTRRAGRLPSVRGAQTAATRAGGQTALVVVTLRGDPNNADQHVVPLESAVAAERAAHPGVTMLEEGGGSGSRAITQMVNNGLHHVEMISLPITLLILVLAFGALVAASVPLLLGITSVAAAIGAGGLVSHLVPQGTSTAPVVILIGLAVGVDYSLFYIRRVRVERRAGATADASLRAAAQTVGRAILIAGATVVIGLAGLLFTGFSVFTSMAVGAILVVAIAVVGSITVLPAVLALLGERIERGRVFGRRRRSTGRASDTPSERIWGRLASVVTGHPRTALATALAMLVALALPVLHMHIANPGDRDVPASTPVIVAEHAIERAFPGSSNTAELVVTGHGLNSAHARNQLAALGREGTRITSGHGEVLVRVARDGRTALVAIPTPDQLLGAERHTVDALRAQLKPATARLIPGARAQLGGGPADDVDFTHQLNTVTPLVIAFVLALAFVLLIAAFRSPWLAVSVIGLNLLSVGAAFGVLVAVFQHTWAQSLLHFTTDGAVVTWLPVFAFVVLFGLSMDYTVLVLERAREAREHGATAREAAAESLRRTGGTVTSAALVMVAVFAVFATLPLLEFKQLGVGLAAAIALDATIVRGLALPATLALLGERGLRARPTRPTHSARVPRVAPEPQWDHAAHVPALDAAHD